MQIKSKYDRKVYSALNRTLLQTNLLKPASKSISVKGKKFSRMKMYQINKIKKLLKYMKGLGLKMENINNILNFLKGRI